MATDKVVYATITEPIRFAIDPDAPILPQVVSLAHRIVTMQNEHASGARVRAIVVEMERPIITGEE